MRKWFLFVTSCAVLFAGDCLFIGDSCVVDKDRPGICQPVSECTPLVTKIEQAGTPMPAHMRLQLQALNCGFLADEPIVCCATPFTNPNPEWRPPDDIGGNWEVTPEPSWNNNQETSTPDSGNQGGTGSLRPAPAISSNSNNSPPNIQGHRNLKLLPTNCGVIESDRIWGGNRTQLYEMPWMVLVKYDSVRGVKLSCGGTLITEEYVLTAAHCVSFLGDLTLNAIVLGEYDVRQDPDCEIVEGDLHCAPKIRNVTIERVIAHPKYSPQKLDDDIALVKLTERADFTLDTMKPICLPTTAELQTENLVGKNGVVAGWGVTEDGFQSPVLLSVDLPVIDNKDCQDRFNGNPRISPGQLCAGAVSEKDSCGGDSGGPIMYPGRISTGAIRYVQRGIVSFGAKRCGREGFPGVYTRISHYMDWILDNIS